MSTNFGTGISLKALVQKHIKMLRCPFFWTAGHLRMVGCRFVLVPPASYPVPNDNVLLPDIEPHIMDLVHRLSRVDDLREKLSSVRDLFYGGVPFHWPASFALFPQPFPDYALVGYMHYRLIEHEREYCNQIDVKYRPRGNENKLYRWEPSRITPTEWTEDPYILCLLLALAQHQYYLGADPVPPLSYRSFLLMTHSDDTESIHLFSAAVSRDLLEALWFPHLAAVPTVWPIIERRKIPFQPAFTFRNRLLQELAEVPDIRDISPPVSPAPDDDVEAELSEHFGDVSLTNEEE